MIFLIFFDIQKYYNNHEMKQKFKMKFRFDNGKFQRKLHPFIDLEKKRKQIFRMEYSSASILFDFDFFVCHTQPTEKLTF